MAIRVIGSAIWLTGRGMARWRPAHLCRHAIDAKPDAGTRLHCSKFRGKYASKCFHQSSNLQYLIVNIAFSNRAYHHGEVAELAATTSAANCAIG
jgi:hypothetical protein